MQTGVFRSWNRGFPERCEVSGRCWEVGMEQDRELIVITKEQKSVTTPHFVENRDKVIGVETML